ncbi:MAG: glucose-6-phosphate dehydrogenase [Thermoleophilia bacterium]
MEADLQQQFADRLETCPISLPELPVNPFFMVIFGGAGDLSTRKLMPTLYHIHKDGDLPEETYITGVGVPGYTDEEYRALMDVAVAEAEGDAFDRESWARLRERLLYVSGDLTDEETYRRLHQVVEERSSRLGNNVLYYLAVPAAMMPTIIERMKRNELCKNFFNVKIIIEKPFGHDRESAVALNEMLVGGFDEDQVYRLDHYLGKETVQNIIFFRFSNPLFEQVWNRLYVDNVQITVAEAMGIEHRGAFYEQTGVVRDIVQNHLLQLVSLVAMEPPVSFAAEAIRDEKIKVFHSIPPINDADIEQNLVRGQYGAGGAKMAGYREEEAVAPDSPTPTFFAARLAVNNWRWAGVPFYVRAGKRLAERLTSICIQFRQPPLKLFGGEKKTLAPNALVLTIQPDEKIELRFGVKYPYSQNQIFMTDLSFSYRDTFDLEPHPDYERLIFDAIRGDLTHFVRQDGIEAMWDIVDPVNRLWEANPPPDFPNYAAGSWGPQAADELLARSGHRWLR